MTWMTYKGHLLFTYFPICATTCTYSECLQEKKWSNVKYISPCQTNHFVRIAKHFYQQTRMMQKVQCFWNVQIVISVGQSKHCISYIAIHSKMITELNTFHMQPFLIQLSREPPVFRVPIASARHGIQLSGGLSMKEESKLNQVSW